MPATIDNDGDRHFFTVTGSFSAAVHPKSGGRFFCLRTYQKEEPSPRLCLSQQCLIYEDEKDQVLDRLRTSALNETTLAGVSSPSMRSKSVRAATRPMSWIGRAMVESGGFEYFDISIFDRPITATCSGTLTPRSKRVRSTPMAIRSDATKYASGSTFFS